MPGKNFREACHQFPPSKKHALSSFRQLSVFISPSSGLRSERQIFLYLSCTFEFLNGAQPTERCNPISQGAKRNFTYLLEGLIHFTFKLSVGCPI